MPLPKVITLRFREIAIMLFLFIERHHYYPIERPVSAITGMLISQRDIPYP